MEDFNENEISMLFKAVVTHIEYLDECMRNAEEGEYIPAFKEKEKYKELRNKLWNIRF